MSGLGLRYPSIAGLSTSVYLTAADPMGAIGSQMEGIDVLPAYSLSWLIYKSGDT